MELSEIKGGVRSGIVRSEDGIRYTIYKVPADIQDSARVEFSLKLSRWGVTYAVYENSITSYFDIYTGRAELEAVHRWIDSIPGLKSMIREVRMADVRDYDCCILFIDGRELHAEVKNEESKWFERTGNITLDAISAFRIRSISVTKYIAFRNYWVSPAYLDTFMKGIGVMRRGSLYESEADIMVKCVLGTDFIKAYDMQRLKKDAAFFEKRFSLRINDKMQYGIEEEWSSAAYCVKPEDIEKYAICRPEDLSDLGKD